MKTFNQISIQTAFKIIEKKRKAMKVDVDEIVLNSAEMSGYGRVVFFISPIQSSDMIDD